VTNPTPQLSAVRILVVEDSLDDYELLRLRLGMAPWPFESERVEDAAAMSAALRDKPWDLVISDHHLPRFSSNAALDVLRASGVDAPFIIVSGMIGEDVAVEAMKSGADDYVMKSNMARLLPAIERSLRNAAARREKHAAEGAVRAGERRMAAIAANIPGVVLRLELDRASGRVELPWVSEGAPLLCGRSAADLRDDPRLLFDALEPADAASLNEAILAAAQGARNLRWEGRGRDDAGGARWWLLAATADAPQADRQGWDGIITDISPEKRALADLQASRERLSELTAHQDSLKEAERAAIAREIHDEMGGLLTGLKADVSWMKKQGACSEPRARDKLRDMEGLLDEVVLVSKRIAKSLRPAILDQGLNAALEWQAHEFEKHSGIPCRFKTNDEELVLEPAKATGVFRVFQEALTNVAKHAGAKRVDVQMFATEKLVTLEVRDDGIGVRKQDLLKGESFGVRGMQERVHHLGGWLDLSGAPGKGTTLMLSIPRNGHGRTRT
jgi:two-component system sensor histidine kinase UhpB